MTKEGIVNELWIKYDWWKMGYSRDLIKSKPKKLLLAALAMEKSEDVLEQKIHPIRCRWR